MSSLIEINFDKHPEIQGMINDKVSIKTIHKYVQEKLKIHCSYPTFTKRLVKTTGGITYGNHGCRTKSAALKNEPEILVMHYSGISTKEILKYLETECNLVISGSFLNAYFREEKAKKAKQLLLSTIPEPVVAPVTISNDLRQMVRSNAARSMTAARSKILRKLSIVPVKQGNFNANPIRASHG